MCTCSRLQFPAEEDGHQPNSRGGYTHDTDSRIKGGMTMVNLKKFRLLTLAPMIFTHLEEIQALQRYGYFLAWTDTNCELFGLVIQILGNRSWWLRHSFFFEFLQVVSPWTKCGQFDHRLFCISFSRQANCPNNMKFPSEGKIFNAYILSLRFSHDTYPVFFG